MFIEQPLLNNLSDEELVNLVNNNLDKGNSASLLELELASRIELKVLTTSLEDEITIDELRDEIRELEDMIESAKHALS